MGYHASQRDLYEEVMGLRRLRPSLTADFASVDRTHTIKGDPLIVVDITSWEFGFACVISHPERGPMLAQLPLSHFIIGRVKTSQLL